MERGRGNSPPFNMYIANQNFLFKGRMVRRGDTVNNPTSLMLRHNLVREVKVVEPEVQQVVYEVAEQVEQVEEVTPAPRRRGRPKKNVDSEA